MADKKLNAGYGEGRDVIIQKAVDLLDGTYALAVAAQAELVAAAEWLTDELREHVTAGARVITTDHASIHDGWGYSIYATFTAVADGDTRNLVITTPATTVDRPYVHLKYFDAWIGNASGTLQIYEDPYDVTGGTPVDVINHRRTGTPPTSDSTVVHTATVTLDNVSPAHTAKLLPTLRFGGGGTGPQGRAGGDRSTDIEWVLEPETKYVIQITNTSGAAADIGFWAFWYEEPALA